MSTSMSLLAKQKSSRAAEPINSSRLIARVLQIDSISACIGVKSIMVFPTWAQVGATSTFLSQRPPTGLVITRSWSEAVRQPVQLAAFWSTQQYPPETDVTQKEDRMLATYQSLAHSRWNCKCHTPEVSS